MHRALTIRCAHDEGEGPQMIMSETGSDSTFDEKLRCASLLHLDRVKSMCFESYITLHHKCLLEQTFLGGGNQMEVGSSLKAPQATRVLGMAWVDRRAAWLRGEHAEARTTTARSVSLRAPPFASKKWPSLPPFHVRRLSLWNTGVRTRNIPTPAAPSAPPHATL